MNYIFGVILSGFLATLAMTFVMYFVHWSKLANGDMIRAIGSFFTDNTRKAFLIGLVLHFSVGIIIAFIYAKLFQIFDFKTELGYLTSGSLMGLAHGFIVSIIMVIMVAEHHPMERYRRVGFPVALLHLLAHVVYGVTLGYLFFRLGLVLPPT